MLNAAQFSSAKEATKSKLMQGALRNGEGEMQSFSKFEKDASKIADIVNETWLRTEYESCRRQAIQGEQFRQLQEDKDLYPYWVYHGVMDDRERDEHVVLEGLVFKIGDPEGDACYPQNGWNCRCSAESVDDQYLEENKLKALTNEEAKGYLESDVDQQFRTNPAIQGTLPNTGSYFETMGSANEGNAKLFNLHKAIDIPEVIVPIFKSTKDVKETAEYMKNPDTKFRKLNPKEEKVFAKNYKEFLSGIDIGQLDSEMDIIAAKNNITWKFKSIEETAFRRGMDIVYRGTAADGEPVRLVRSFYVRDGKRYVEHELFQIPKSLQGNGMSKDVLSTFYKQYENAGISNISIHANIDVGGYAWGKYGFSAEKKDALGILSETKGKPFYNDAKKIFDKHFKDDTYTKVFPMNKWSNTTFGKEMLLKSDWSGGLNLADSEQKSIFESYLSKKK